jgi:site-specific DNA-methyltransferase (adenine-specific)
LSFRTEQLTQSVILHGGDCLTVLASMGENSIDSCVTDPPYHLTSIVKRFGADNAAPAKSGKTGAYARASAGFMGKRWDGGDVAFQVETWKRVWRVLKPGAHLIAFSGTRTYHRMVCAIDDAGFEIRDQIGWAFGQGFPKSHNIGDGWGTALKPAWEPVVVARKPLDGTVATNFAKWGTGALNIDGCRVGTGNTCKVKLGGKNDFPNEDDAWTPKSVVAGSDCGRWPANLIHDGSDEVVCAFPDSDGAQGIVAGSEPSETGQNGIYGRYARVASLAPRGDSGSAARFFYSAKADSDDRLGSKHPTVKPVDLIQYLVRLVTPPRGLVLDCFAGTGTCGEACIREGMRAVLIEREEEYQEDIRRRMKLAMAGPDERARESIKAKTKDKPVDAGPLFGGSEESRGGGGGRQIYGHFADQDERLGQSGSRGD